MATTYLDRSNEPPDALNRFLARVYTLNWVTVAYAVLFVAAILTRFVNLGARVMSHDESLHTYYSYLLETTGVYVHTPLMHGPILFHVNALMYFLFGDSDFTARLYPAILGVILVMLPILFRRWLGKWGAVLCSVMLLISPLLMYYNRYIREDTPCYVAAILMVYAIFMYLDGPEHLRRRARWLYLLTAALIWCLGSKESAFIYIAIFGSFVTLYWLARVYQSVRRQPIHFRFNFGVIAILLGALAALGMTMVLNIALSTSDTLSDRVTYVMQQVQTIFSGGQPTPDFTAFVLWTLIVVGIIIALIVGTALWTMPRRTERFRVLNIIIMLLLTMIAGLVLVVVEERTLQPKANANVADTIGVVTTNLPLIATWIFGLAGIAAALYMRAAGWWRKLYRFPEFDVLIVMGSLVLPWLTAFVIKATGASPTDYSSAGIQRAVIAVIPFLALSAVVGLAWNWKRWIICALVFYVPFAFFFTTMFTNPQGLATGMIGSLGYWLEQQGVQRGSQPRYYYALVIMPVYEYFPLIGSFLAMLAGLTHLWRNQTGKAKHSEVVDELSPIDLLEQSELTAPETKIPVLTQSGALKRIPFLLFVSWWGVFNFFAYTVAGEKMPWLGVHMTIPLIFLSAWYFGGVFSRMDWSRFRSRGWLYLLLLPLLGIAIFQAIAPFVVGASPFQGLQQHQLANFYQWLAVIGVALIVLYVIVQVIIRTGFLHFRRMVAVTAFVVLSLLTFRTAFMASFINYDYANEYLVYAHGAPGIKLMMQQIQDISERTTDGMNIKFAWGGNAWPVTWYFRHLTNATFFAGNPTSESLKDAVVVYASDDIQARVEPLLEDRYYKFTYIRMWWPDQEYFYLTPERVNNALDFSPSNTQAAQIRQGMFDIWWKRDYTQYGLAINKDYSLQNWPVSEKFYVYVRKDVAAQVWNMGTGDATVQNPLQNQTTNICTSNWQQKAADVVFANPQNVALNHPLDVAVDNANNRVYVAEESNNRISVFDKSGNYITSVQGGTGDFTTAFNRPNGVAVAPNGNLYVADTWNYMIREFSLQGKLITSWGQAGQFGAGAPVDPKDGFWGPRDVTVDDDGNVYVADTGNKRVRVYDANGNYLRDIGSGGSALGQLDEPSGLAIDNADHLLYVADTWNKRISVFDLAGNPKFTFDVHGWYEDLGNRPYLAIDETRRILYVSDPDAGRVLVYDLRGNCLGSFGQPSDTPADNTQFNTIGGMSADSDGNVYIADAGAGRVLKFGPFTDAVLPPPQQGAVGIVPQAQITEQVTEQTTEQATEQATEQPTPEVTAAG